MNADTFHQHVFDAIPLPVFVLAADLSVRDFNDAAIDLPEAVLEATVRPEWEGSRVGQVLGCVYSGQECGTSRGCASCQIVRVVERAITDEVRDTVIPMTVLRDGRPVSVEYRAQAVRFSSEGEKLTVLTMQQQTPTTQARQSVCARGCGK